MSVLQLLLLKQKEVELYSFKLPPPFLHYYHHHYWTTPSPFHYCHQPPFTITTTLLSHFPPPSPHHCHLSPSLYPSPPPGAAPDLCCRRSGGRIWAPLPASLPLWGNKEHFSGPFKGRLP